MGRWAIFRGKVKDQTHRKQAFLTDAGLRSFEASRRVLASLYRQVMGPAAADVSAADVSDADVIEFGARGHEATRRYLRELRRRDEG